MEEPVCKYFFFLIPVTVPLLSVTTLKFTVNEGTLIYFKNPPLYLFMVLCLKNVYHLKYTLHVTQLTNITA